MNFEDLQKAWKSQDTGARLVIDADILLNEVRRNQQQFRATIFWRDVREVGAAFLLAVFFVVLGIQRHDWTHGLVALACFGVGAFMMADRLRQRRMQPAADATLKSCVETSLRQVNHQIWLLKNVFWWYLLPIAAALGISTCAAFLRVQHPGRGAFIGWGAFVLFGALLYWGIYWVNQFAVRKSLDPRRQELETLLAGLDENSK
jgi:hypothetical protein